jgi:hypothetical protein
VSVESARNLHSVPDSVETRMRPAARPHTIGGVTLADWLNEYRNLAPDSVVREVAEPEDDWEEPESIFADPDRVRDTTPRWRERAERVGYGRVTAF